MSHKGGDGTLQKNEKVYYYLDDATTPYVSTMPSSGGVVTLLDFKNSFTKRGYKYFCKEYDTDIDCEVKVELVDDDDRLRKSKNGIYELFLVSIPGYGTLPRTGGTLNRNHTGTLERRRRRSLVEINGIPFSEGPSSVAPSQSTVISRCAGEHLAEVYMSNSEDPYRYDDSTRLTGESSLYEPLAMNGRPYDEDRVRRRKPRKERYRRAYVPSTISSATESSVGSGLPRILEIFLPMKNVPYLGLNVTSLDGNIYVSGIAKGGAVDIDRRIELGDQILQVNRISFEELSVDEAVSALRVAAASKKPITLYVSKFRASDFEDPMSSLASETMPLDVSVWVETAVQNTEKMRALGIDPQDATTTFDDGTLPFSTAGSDDEEQMLYDQRRNGVPRALLEEAERRRENEQNEQYYPEHLTETLDPMIVIRAMARPDSGLQVKNRKWLKILVPMSFIGRDLVDWLLEHVVDLRDRKAARAYASRLLAAGLIRHVVSKLTFTEKCYYVFGDGVVVLGTEGRNVADSSGTSGGTRAEATTEVTYVGSPAPVGMRLVPGGLATANRNGGALGQGRHRLETTTLSPVAHDATWYRRRKGCESPLTNDYASMVGESHLGAGGYSTFVAGVHSGRPAPSQATSSCITSGFGGPPPTPLSGTAVIFAPPHPSPCETDILENLAITASVKMSETGLVEEKVRSKGDEKSMSRRVDFDPNVEEVFEKRRPTFNSEEEGVPGEVTDYLVYFSRMIDEQNVEEVLTLYDQAFPDLTERFFRDRMWPDEHVVERMIGPGNRIFIILYKELYFRQLYARNARGPQLVYRVDSFMNYQDLFSELLSSKEPVPLSLPNIWLWDIVDEFVYQFQAFCLYKANPQKRTSDEVDELINIEETQNAWNIYPVLNILYSLLSKSQINEQLNALREKKNPDLVADEFGQSDLYFKLGYFSLIGLLRTHVLLGDYHQALKTVQYIDIDPKGLYNTVPTCLVTLHYFVGFSHLMMRNYGEATRLFVNCLLYIQRTKNVQTQQQTKKNTFTYDVIGKTWEQLFHLLAICLAVQPQRIDESIASQLAERCGDRMSHMANGSIEEFRSAFSMGCPKFLSPTTVAYEGANLSKEPLLRQLQSFLEGIESQMALPILRGYLKLYTTLPTKKLASFMDVDDEHYDSFLGKLLTYKMIVNELGKEGLPATNDEEEPTTDIDFYVDRDMICIADTKVARRVGEHFIRHIQKLHEVQQQLTKLEIKP
ncbi:unnamed protein product [Caenorhabditis auriculariae]|uniref:Eukaryotic translation initiation factor 3 subunit L n=1 Tax=Caenorhabditis auriculariae TaxID=2777116 RepID=A0A8S1H9Z5_9PELO|nr:unnamed protein product [Caenorhabditis auriculariae]